MWRKNRLVQNPPRESGSGVQAKLSWFKTLADARKEVRELGRIRRKRIRWEPSSDAGVTGYRLYWSKDGDVSYDSDHIDLGLVTEVILPDGIPSFPLVASEIGLGITAFNEAGNESDMTKTAATINFLTPDAPRDLLVEDMD
jgi:hypothetical protein